ncbi:MAG: hypothetical protein MUP27_10425, partial [Desulfobacterales bacterium]|nr:hypothetical protein [Desulfobacterales bacterium]
KDEVARKLNVDDLFNIMNNEGTCVGKAGIMFRPEENLKESERAVPIEYLNDKSKRGFMTNYCESMSMDETLSSKECRSG